MKQLSDAEVCRRGIELIDNTTLNLNDTEEAMDKIAAPFLGEQPHPAAVCVYPKFIRYLRQKYPNVDVATVVNFPSGQEPTEKVLADTKQAIADGAAEIDMVIDYKELIATRSSANAQKLVAAVRAACPRPALLKVIIESGELKDPALIAMASQAAVEGGADFVKTSTGKVPVNATIDAAAIMLATIKAWTDKHPDAVIGFKPAGGVKTVEQVRQYFDLARLIMGEEWVTRRTFRFGASSLLYVLKDHLAGKPRTAGAATGY